jgi:sortase A
MQSVLYADDYHSSFPSSSNTEVKQAGVTQEDTNSSESVSASTDALISAKVLYPPEKVPYSYDGALYPVYPEEGDKIGSLIIPILEQKLPIFQGTGTNELKKGVGHFIQSVLPGEEDNCVLSGHRDTVFAKLGKLKIGDQLIIETSAGTFTYVIQNIRIVNKDDRTVIVPTDHAVLTLTTCYPFKYIGSAPLRYIISSDLVASNPIDL